MADVEKGLNPSSFRWRAPTQNVDGTPVDGVLSYNLYRANTEEALAAGVPVYFVVVGVLQEDGSYEAPIDQFPAGRHVIALTAVDIDNDESLFSNTLGFTRSAVGVPPNPPVFLDV